MLGLRFTFILQESLQPGLADREIEYQMLII